MKRRLFTILSALSLVLCILTVTIWVRSYSPNNWPSNKCIGWTSHNDTRGWGVWLRWEQGTVAFDVVHANLRTLPIADNQVRTDQQQTIEAEAIWGSVLCFRRLLPQSWRNFFSYYDAGFTEIWTLYMPCWLVLLLTGVMPAMWRHQFWHRRGRRFRERHGLCLHCGYDLRASTERCPECGTLIPVDLVRKPVA